MPVSDGRFIASHNPAVVGPNSKQATCFDGSEIRLPSGYTKGRRPETSAFLRSIASSGNDFGRRGRSLFGDLGQSRATRRCPWLRPVDPISAQSLGCLAVSRRLG
jgi:hypothetical protein